MRTSRPRRVALAVTTMLVSGVMAATGGSVISAPAVASVRSAATVQAVASVQAIAAMPASRSGASTTPVASTSTATTGSTGSTGSTATAVTVALRIAVVGDSVAWGQGLAEGKKYGALVKAALARRSGRAVGLDVYAHSGATLAGPCPLAPPALPGEVPVSTPSVACQLVAAAASGHSYDLVLLSGCINDVTTQFVLLGKPSVAAATRQACSAPLTAAVRAARALPGHPAVVVTGYYPIISRQTPQVAFTAALRAGLGAGAPVDPAADPKALRTLAIRRSAQFTAAFDQVGQAAVTAAGGRSRAVFVSPGFGAADALFALHSKLWNGTDDEALATRTAACAAVPGLTPTARQLCTIASVGHPNVAGAARYATRIEAAITRWFRTA